MNLADFKDVKLTSQEIYDIVNDTIADAEDAGFLNAFVCERSLIVHLILVLIEDIEDRDQISLDNPLQLFDDFVEKGYVNSLMEQYGATVDYVAKVVAIWYQDYEKYLLSVSGMLTKAEVFSSNNIETLSKQFQELLESDTITESLQVAEKWGMNRQLPRDAEEKKIPQSELTLL